MVSPLAQRYGEVQASISAACAAASRERSSVELIVISKFHPAQLVLDLMLLGQHTFGENKDQEARPKFAEVNAALANDARYAQLAAPDVHFVGQLQSNKAKSVLRYASTIHSLDRESLLAALAKERANLAAAAETSQTPPTGVFIELNLTDDPARGGIQPANLLGFAEKVLATDGLKLLGVMGVATLEGEEERDFATIAAASRSLQTLAPDARFISAGMSGDYALAIAHGATHLRIGTAITGPRQYLA